MNNFKKYKYKNIFFRTFMLSLLISTVIILIFAGATIPRQKENLLRSLEAQANTICLSIMQSCANALILEDYSFIVKHNLEVVQNYENIMYIIVSRKNGFTLIQTRSGWEQRPNIDPIWVIPSKSKKRGDIVLSSLINVHVFHYSIPIKYSIVEWGDIYIGLSVDQFYKQLSQMYIIIFSLSLFCIGLATFASYLFARKMTRPILSLINTISQIGQGELSARASITTGDELEILADAFNQMTEKLNKTTVSRDFLDQILENMTECLIVTTENGVIQLVNNALLRMLNYCEEELVGNNINILFYDTNQPFLINWNSDLIAKGYGKHIETSLKTQTGEIIPALFSKGAIYLGDSILGIVCVALNIQERKKAEEAIQSAYQKLQETQSQLIQTAKLASIGELAAGVAHELNQPLMIIRTGVQLMIRSAKKKTLQVDQLENQFESIEKNTKRMMNIINHLRSFSRQSETSFVDVDINELVDNTFLMIGEQLRLRNIEVIKEVSPTIPKIKGNPNQLEQVFLNLLANSRDAIEEKGKSVQGKITIVLHCIEPSNNGGKCIEILFKDNGSGIPQDKLEKIYDPFYTTKEVGKGTGLGLSISFGIIKEHHGDIQVIETSPEGTTFSIKFPIAM
ncbi:MAG: PAS domain S-box protein [Desulfobacterales bacterium]|nr:PAS domain S-box protein [Desulfobacterales bacterium]